MQQVWARNDAALRARARLICETNYVRLPTINTLVKSITFIALLGATLLLLLTTFIRLNLNYNESGIYFDEVAVITYDAQAIIGYACLSGIFLLLSILMGNNLIRTISRSKKK